MLVRTSQCFVGVCRELTEIDHAYLLVSVIGEASTGQVPVALDVAEPVRR
jgi:hypothetical protein